VTYCDAFNFTAQALICKPFSSAVLANAAKKA
jgi:hypothetical protein